MQTPVDSEIQLLKADRAAFVTARLVGPWPSAQRSVVADVWRAFRDTVPEESRAQDGSASWGDFVGLFADIEGDQAELSFAILNGDVCEGFLIARTNVPARLPENSGRRLVYVEYLAAAPWNQRSAPNRRFLLVGQHLLWAAALASIDANLHGLVGLHSKLEVELFYERCGLRPLADEFRNADNHRYYEWSMSDAQVFLASVGG